MASPKRRVDNIKVKIKNYNHDYKFEEQLRFSCFVSSMVNFVSYDDRYTASTYPCHSHFLNNNEK